jgi:hypothetical protein
MRTGYLMTDHVTSAPELPQPGLKHFLHQHGRWLVKALASIGVLGLLATFVISIALHGSVHDVQSLSAPRTAEDFVGEMSRQNDRHWVDPAYVPHPGQEALSPDQLALAASAPTPANRTSGVRRDKPEVDIRPLRIALFIDSLMIVPAYLGLLLLEILLCANLVDWQGASTSRDARMSHQELRLHLLCMVPVAAALFDITENGIIVRACEDAISHVLSNGILEDRALATECKWVLLGLSAAILARLALRALPRLPRIGWHRGAVRWAIGAGTVTALAALCTAIGEWLLRHGVAVVVPVRSGLQAIELLALVTQLGTGATLAWLPVERSSKLITPGT